jgi:hypothetical protein
MRVGRLLVRAVPTVAVAAVVSLVAALAVNATGQKVERVEANNAALWVTNDKAGVYGRFNKASSFLENSLYPGEAGVAGSLDVLQDRDTVVVRDLDAGTLVPVDSMTSTNGKDAAVGVSATAKADLRGGTLAVLDPASGKLWAVRTEGTAHQLDLSGFDASNSPIADLGAVGGNPADVAGLSVGSDGSVHAASASGKVVTIPVTDSGFGQPAYSDLPAGLQGVQVAALGSQTAVFAAKSGTLILPGGRTQQLQADAKAQLQQGGADVGSVAVATSKDLLRVTYDGTVATLFSADAGAPAAPVNIGVSAESGSCILGAWAGDPGTVARSCGGQPAQDLTMDGATTNPADRGLYDPVFRVNWGLVVLNDRENGRIYDVDLQRSLDDWKSVETKQQDKNQDKKQKTTKPTEAKPKAEDDAYGARPDRTSVLHVLDNDADPNGKVLSITAVTQPKNGAKVLVAPDGQTLEYQQPADGRDGSFQYTISNQVAQATATVIMKAENGDENQQPEKRLHYKEPVFNVASAGNVTIPVIGDFRDHDGDPLTVVSASDGKDDVPVTSDGQIEYTAPSAKEDASRTLTFELTDGNSAAVQGTVRVKIAGDDDTIGIAPVAQADAAIGEVGQPITVLPLANDIPGVDPADEDTRLTLAADVEGWKQARITTDRDTGRVTIVSKQHGTHYLKYKAAFGSAPTATGEIRVDVREKVDDKPVAMPDQAVVRGQRPITVDVLANDSDPHGGLLTVQTASASNEDMLQVAVIKGRWLRIVPLSADVKPNPLAVSYQVINGQGETATGSVLVTHLKPLDEDAPLVRGDTATVRAGDSTLIPVLANDLTLGGSTLTLATKVGKTTAGELPVTDPTKNADADQGDVGRAFVSGNQVRYVAPAQVDAQKQVTIEYVAQAGQRKATGQVSVTINPEPTEANPDSPPEPTSIEARVTSGDTLTIPVPASNQDPDGDSVALVGLGSGPQLGRVISISPKGITYQAFPTDDGLGTDSFQYVVADKYGQTGTGTVRVAVTPPGQTQIPVAVDDDVMAKPGAQVQVDVIANDLIAMSDTVKIKPLAKPPAGVTLAGDQGPIVATVPAADAEPITVDYQLTGNGGDGTTGTVTISGKDGYLNPPQLQDQVATLAADGKTASADVLAKAWDPDGSASGLTVSAVSEPTATVAGGTVTVPVKPQPQVLSYQVKDADGAVAAALIYVPSSGDGLPYAHGTIQLPDRKTTVDLADYVTSPRGKPIRITLASSVSVSPPTRLKAVPGRDLTTVELSLNDDYVGPATLNLEVTDGSSLTDPDGKTAVVSIPVQVGPETPVLRCPKDPQTVTRGSTAKAMNLVGLCHVWTPASIDVASLTFTAAWDGEALADVTPTVEGQSLVLQATGDAKPGAKGTLTVAVAGTKATGTLVVAVKDARKARYKPEQVLVKQGETVSGTIQLDSPITVGRQDTIVAMPHLDGASETFSGANWSVTANPDFYGPLAYDLTLSDVANTATTDRQIHGTLTVSVYGIPAAPDAPTSGKTAQNHAVTLTWRTPANHGATIEKYMVRQSGGRGDGSEVECDSNTCTIKGLDNDVPVQFQVKAYNKAGWSDYGHLSQVFRPDRVPDAVSGFTSSNPDDHKITLSWGAVTGDFSSVTSYEITWPGGHASAGGGATSKVIPGVANEQTTFSIWAKNRMGKSKQAARTKGWPTGKPLAFGVDSVTADLDKDSPVATVSWSAADPNGRGPVTYQVKDGAQVVCSDVKATSCHVGKIALDGASHTFTVIATNYYNYSNSASTSWKAVGNVGKWDSDLTLSETGNDREFTLSTTTPNSRGSSGKLSIDVGGNGTTRNVNATGEKVNLTLQTPGNGQNYTVKLTLCNEDSNKDCSSTSGSVNTYGKLAKPSISASSSDQTASFSVGGINGNGRDATLVVTSSRGYNRSFNVPANGSTSFSDSQTVGWSTDVTFSAHLEPKSGQKRGNSDSASAGVTTRAKPNPVANFSLGGQVGGNGAYKDWYYADLELSDWNPNSTVHCGADSTQTDLKDWSQSFGVNGSGHWGRGQTTLMVHNAAALPDSSVCRQQ